MKIDAQELATRELSLTVEVEAERLQAAMRATARRLAEKQNIPGFRKGKAPYPVILRQFGEEHVRQAAVEALGQEIYRQALDETQTDAYDAGSLTDVTYDPLVFKYLVPLKPLVDLGAYRGVRLPFQPPQAGDEELENALEHLREHHVLLEPAERPAQLGDVVVVDVVGTLIDREPPEPLSKDEAVNLRLEEDTTWPLPGVAAQLIGAVAGEERQVDTAVPDDYENEALRGRTAHFVVKVSSVKSRFVPEWSDSLAKEMGEFETMLDLRVGVRKELQETTDREYAREYAEGVKDTVTAGATVLFPPAVLEREIDNLLDDLDRRLREQRINLETYLKIQKRSREDLRGDLRETAIARLRRTLVLGKVIEVERLDLETGEVEKRIERLVSAFGDDGAKINKLLSSEAGKRSTAADLLVEKAVERLVAIAKGEAPPLPPPAAIPAPVEPAESAPEAPPQDPLPVPVSAEVSPDEPAPGDELPG